MHDGLNDDTLRHSNAWVKVANEIVKHTLANEPCVVKCPCRRCQNLIRLKQHELSIHLCKYDFKPDYLEWCEHGDVDSPTKSNIDEDVDRVEDMIDDIRHSYPALETDQPSPEEVK